MLDIKSLRNNLNLARQALTHRGETGEVLDQILALDERRRALQTELDGLRSENKGLSKTFGQAKSKGEDTQDLMATLSQIKAKIAAKEETEKTCQNEVGNLLANLPNFPQDSVPQGKSEKDNVIIRTWGKKPTFDFQAQEHTEIGERLGILSFDRAAQMSGARFALYQGAGAQLERALINFMLDLHIGTHGYQEVLPPFLVLGKALFGTGQLPKFEADLFKVEGENPLYLIPTAEVPVTNIHREEVLKEQDLPIRYAAYTPCFRSEAGSYGKESRGLIRQHQFNKVELVQFCAPEHSAAIHEALTGHAETVLQQLGLPYRVVELCTGDLGFSSSKTYDLEVWLPGQAAYREISSCSNFSDFQARRANIRFKPKGGGKPQWVHTLNGSGLAVGRTFVAILENYQQGDGSVIIPEILRPYMRGLEKITSP